MPNGLKVKANLAPANRRLEKLRAALTDLRPALKNAATELTRRVWYRFAFKRDPDGRPWAPWAPSTAASNRKHPRRKLMLDTRQLRDTTKFIPGRQDLRAVIGTSYGKYHEQPDGKPGTGRLPRRAFLFSRSGSKRGLSQADENYLLNALRYQLRKAAKD
ncbi:Phage virion morphogenesis family protein [compost metagenome]